MNPLLLLRLFAIGSMVAGLGGMIFCLPYLFSSDLRNLVGAGFPFLAGAVLFGAGLVTLGLITRPDIKKKADIY